MFFWMLFVFRPRKSFIIAYMFYFNERWMCHLSSGRAFATTRTCHSANFHIKYDFPIQNGTIRKLNSHRALELRFAFCTNTSHFIDSKDYVWFVHSTVDSNTLYNSKMRRMYSALNKMCSKWQNTSMISVIFSISLSLFRFVFLSYPHSNAVSKGLDFHFWYLIFPSSFRLINIFSSNENWIISSLRKNQIS